MATQTCHIWIGAGTNSTSGTAYSTNPAWTVPSNITTSSTVNITIKSGSAGGYLTPSGGSGQQASDYYLCDSAGNNAVFIQTFTAQTTTNNNPKTVNLRGLAGKVLYLKEVKTSNGNSYNGGIHIRGDCYFTVTYDTYGACTAPTSVTLAQQSNGVLRVSWSGAAGGANNSIASYYVYLSTSSGGGVSGSLSATVTTTATSGTKDFTVNNTTTYYAAVRTQGSAGSSYYSGYKWSAGKAAYYYTACGAPTSVSLAQQANGVLRVSWSGASGGTNNAISSYYIYLSTSSGGGVSGSLSATVSTTATSGSRDFTVNNTTTYYAAVRTQGQAGSSYYSGYKWSGGKAAYYYTACGAPTSVTLAQQSNGVLRVSWSGASGGTNNSISSYYIYLSTSSGGGVSGSLSATITTTATSGTRDFTVNNTTTYYAAVRTQGSAGSSYYSGYKWSTGKAAYYYTACKAPTSVSLTQQANGVLRVSWSGASGGTNNAISSYYVYLSTSSGGGVSGSLSATVSTTAASGTRDFTVNNTTTYYAAVRTQGGAGSSYYSGYKWSGANAAYYYTNCGAPSSISLSRIKGQVTITWTSGTNGTNNNINGYGIIRNTNPINTNAVTISNNSNNTSLIDTPGPGNFYYGVRSQGTAGSAYYSEYKWTNDYIIVPPEPNVVRGQKITKEDMDLLKQWLNTSQISAIKNTIITENVADSYSDVDSGTIISASWYNETS